jgi:tetratricopeptide (TPR) repeat protein
MKHFTKYSALLLVLIATSMYAGGGTTNPKTQGAELTATDDPEVLYKRKFYKEAIEKYQLKLAKDKDNIDIIYKIGMSYLLGAIDYTKAIPFLKKAAESEKDSPKDAYYMLGKAYHNAMMFDRAVEAYQKANEVLSLKSDNESKELNLLALKEIENCKFAKDAIKTPENVTFENLGKEVNSAFSDLDPYITPNKTEMVFSSNRPDGNQCAKPRKFGYTFDAYISNYKGGKWSKPMNMGPNVNTPLNERVSSISSDGSSMFFYIDNEESTKDGDIYVSTASGKTYLTPVNLKGLVNTSSEESNASINQDGSNLYFASDKDGGAGGKDLYVAKKLPNGNWGEPKRLSNTINTKYNEDYPVIMPDDKTLYFCSEGHTNFGGYDIFRSVWVDTLNDWSTPENLGYPVNTPQDNFSISITDKKHEGYISAIRPEGFGNYDLYKIIFNEAESAPYTIVRGNISNGDPNGIQTKIQVEVTSKKSNEVVAKFNVSPKKKGKFFAVFYPGDYKLAITNEECKPFTTDLTIVDKNNRGDLINKDFNLTALKSFEPVEDKTKKTTPTQDKGVKKPIVQPKKN